MNIEEMMELLDRPIAFHRIFVTWTGSVKAALMLSQLFYWSKRTSNKDGWIYKTSRDWTEETGLTRREQEKARRILRNKNLIEEKIYGIPAMLHFRISAQFAENVKPRLHKKGNLGATNCASKVQQKSETKYQRLRRDYKTESRERECAPRHAAELMDRNGEDKIFHSPAGELCGIFQRFIVRHRFHIGRKKPNVHHWLKSSKGLIESVGFNRAKKVLQWYVENYNNRFTPHVHAMTTFCDDFHKIEKAMYRETGGTPPTSPGIQTRVIKAGEKWSREKELASLQPGETIAFAEDEDL